MNHMTLAQKIQLHPRVSLLKGHLFERKKAGGTVSAVLPHYATTGIPMVCFDTKSGSPIDIQAHGAEIECNFRETEPKIQPIITRHFSNHILVQLMYGKKGESPSKASCRILREASACFAKLIDTKQELYLAGLFVLKVSGGSSDGILVPLGLFDIDGNTLWINPEALELELLNAPFSKYQIEQSTKDEVHWYEQIHDNLRHLFNGDDLHKHILESRAGALIESGKLKTKRAAINQAAREAKLFCDQTVLTTKLNNKLTKHTIKTGNNKTGNDINSNISTRSFSIKKIRGD